MIDEEYILLQQQRPQAVDEGPDPPEPEPAPDGDLSLRTLEREHVRRVLGAQRVLAADIAYRFH